MEGKAAKYDYKAPYRTRYVFLAVVLVVFFVSCSSEKLVDRSSSFQKWSNVPLNSKYLEIDMRDSLTGKKIKNRTFYLTFHSGFPYSIDYALVEVQNETGIGNRFPLPTNASYIDLKQNELFPAPSLFNTCLRISSEYIDGIGYFEFSKYNLTCSGCDMDDKAELIDTKHIMLNFQDKRGVLLDTASKGDSKLW